MKKSKKRPTEPGDAPPAESAAEAPQAEEAQPAAAAPAEPAADVDWKDRFLRAKADFANLQRRSGEELQAAVRYANGDFARTLLDPIDDLERTLQAAEADGGGPLLEGVKLVHQKLLKTLMAHHIERIEALGRPFDPTFHEALMQQPSAEHEPNTVIQEVQSGYRLHDRVLRPARVIVSTSAETVEAETPGNSED